jgi:TP901 family phage tail tape measure protein
MVIQAAQLSVKVSADGADQTISKVKSVGDAVDQEQKRTNQAAKDLHTGLSNTFKTLAFAVGGGALAAGFLGGKAVGMAGDFQQSMTQLVTGAGESQKNLGQVSQGILDMAVKTGTATRDLAAGMYMIESAGYHGAAGLKVLQAAAEGAKVGNADLATVANGVTTIMTDYAKTGITASQATNILVATVASGKTHMTDLAAALSTILPTSSAVGVSMKDTAAAMATMTGEGTAAADASTYLRQLLMSLEAPASKTVKQFKEIGLSADDVAKEMKVSLPDTLQMIEDHLAKVYKEGSPQYVDALKNIAGGARQMEGILQLTGSHLQVFKDNLAGISDAVKKGGDAITGWNKVQGDFNFQMDKAKAVLETVGITIGRALLPTVTDFLQKGVIPLAQRFQDWLTKGGGLQDFQTVITNIANFFQNELIPAFTTFLNQDIVPLAQGVATLWQGAVNLFQAFQQGQPYADAVAIALGTLGSAIALIKIEEFAAGFLNAFADLASGQGIIYNLANEMLPELTQALGFTKTAAVETSAAVEGIGTASAVAETTVTASSAAMALALGVATAGISLLVGAAIAGIAASAVTGQNAMSKATQQAYDSLGKSADDMKAKSQADAAETQVTWQNTGDALAGRWQRAGEQMAKSSADARAKFIIDQQKMADAAEAAAQRADAAWGRASQAMDIVGLLRASGWTDMQIAKYLGQNVSSNTGTTLNTGQHIGAHAAGILNNPTGHWAMVGERGPELMHVPQGASILPNGMTPADLGGAGSNQPIMLSIDGVQFARVVMPYLTNQIRYSVGSVGW